MIFFSKFLLYFSSFVGIIDQSGNCYYFYLLCFKAFKIATNDITTPIPHISEKDFKHGRRKNDRSKCLTKQNTPLQGI